MSIQRWQWCHSFQVMGKQPVSNGIEVSLAPPHQAWQHPGTCKPLRGPSHCQASTSNSQSWWAKYGPLPRCLAAMRLTVSAGLEHLRLSLSLACKFTKLVIAVSTIINLNDCTVLQCLVSWRRCHNMSSMPASCTDPTECC